MSNQVISYADLSIINSAIKAINNHVGAINGEVGAIHTKQHRMQGELEKLLNEFAMFVATDARHKALHLAETRVGNLKQDLQIRFGYYAEIRRMAAGILQGVDSGVVSDGTLQFTTEEIMLKAPGYWLAPALVALASWIRNDKTHTDKALAESIRRDDYKTTLFFMLVMRRLVRYDAAMQWLERYFMHQDPYHLEREFVIILEAVTAGAFPPASRGLMMRHVRDWIEQLTQSDDFIELQKQQWIGFFEVSGPAMGDDFPLLKKFATSYAKLEAALRAAKAYELLQAHFTAILSPSAGLTKAVKAQLDEMLTLLVTHFDDEELPLQKQVRLNQLIIDMDGDKTAAQAKMDAEEHVFDEKVDFLQLLANAAFNPLQTGASKATQALAVSISQPWILEALDTFVARSRNAVPVTIDLKIEGLALSLRDGSEEEQLLRQQDDYYAGLKMAELNKLSFPYGSIIFAVLIFLGGCWAASLLVILALIIMGVAGLLVWNALKQYKKARQQAIDRMEERNKAAREVLRGCVAETVDYRSMLAKEDANAAPLRGLLATISPEDFSSISRETARSLIQN